MKKLLLITLLLGFSLPVATNAAKYCDYQSPLKRRAPIITDYSRAHKAIDLKTGKGTLVRAADDGVVVKIVEPKPKAEMTEPAKVVIRHDDVLQTVYSQLRRIRVVEGDIVTQGQSIGRTGGRGYGSYNSSRYHLHFAVKKNGHAVNPYCVVNPRKDIPVINYQVKGDNILNPYKPEVTSDYQRLQERSARHAKVWNRFTKLIPAEHRTDVRRFIVTTDGRGGTFGAVVQNAKKPQKWNLIVDIKDAYKSIPENRLNNGELNYTLLHEFGHLLTLNKEQVDYNADENGCSTYYALEGCTISTSYLHNFWTTFWEGELYDEWLEIQTIIDDTEYYDALDEFYENHQSEFVTRYSSTNPGEDIAEAWTAFIQQSKPTSSEEEYSIAEQKILFFYDYPELVELRNSINSSLNGDAVTTVEFTVQRQTSHR